MVCLSDVQPSEQYRISVLWQIRVPPIKQAALFMILPLERNQRPVGKITVIFQGEELSEQYMF